VKTAERVEGTILDVRHYYTYGNGCFMRVLYEEGTVRIPLLGPCSSHDVYGYIGEPFG
jgi:hypothetical protein